MGPTVLPGGAEDFTLYPLLTPEVLHRSPSSTGRGFSTHTTDPVPRIGKTRVEGVDVLPLFYLSTPLYVDPTDAVGPFRGSDDDDGDD